MKLRHREVNDLTGQMINPWLNQEFSNLKKFPISIFIDLKLDYSCIQFIISNVCLLGFHYMSGLVLGVIGATVNKTGLPALLKFIFQGIEWTPKRKQMHK